jgi:hypothetical protein
MIFDKVSDTYYDQSAVKMKDRLQEAKPHFLISLIAYPIFALTFYIFTEKTENMIFGIVMFLAALGMSWNVVTGMAVIMCRLTLRKLKKASERKPILEIKEDGTVSYRARADYRADTLEVVHKMEYLVSAKNPDEKIFRISGKNKGLNSQIDIVYELADIKLIQEILNTFIVMDKSKTLNYTIFKDMLKEYKNTPDKMLKEIQTLDYLLAVNYCLDTAPKTSRVITLPHNGVLEYEVQQVDDKDYICLYTSYDEIPKDNKYLHCIKISYQGVIDILKQESDNALDIFTEGKLDGIMINPPSDKIIIN